MLDESFRPMTRFQNWIFPPLKCQRPVPKRPQEKKCDPTVVRLAHPPSSPVSLKPTSCYYNLPSLFSTGNILGGALKSSWNTRSSIHCTARLHALSTYTNQAHAHGYSTVKNANRLIASLGPLTCGNQPVYCAPSSSTIVGASLFQYSIQHRKLLIRKLWIRKTLKLTLPIQTR